MDKCDLTYNFSFPFPPYIIQQEFMNALFKSLDEKKLGIFESPTGTGKSLSIICGALTWLEQHENAHKEVLINAIGESTEENDTDDWFNEASKRIEKENEKRKARKELDKMEKQENRIKNLRLKKQFVKQKLLDNKKADEDFRDLFPEAKNDVELNGSDSGSKLLQLENEFLLDDFKSDDEGIGDENDSEEDVDDGCLKIFYCSRTHSQLSQFVREIQKTRFGRDSRVTSLASRQNLCVNPDVLKLSSLSLINERCLDMQTAKKGVPTELDLNQPVKKKKVSAGCPFNKQTNIENLSNQVLLEVQDIEQLVDLGRKSKACPYYSSRKSIKDSQLVVLPYNTLLHKGTREACKIKLKDNIVIVDEAHNLLETIGNIHSVMLSYNQVCCAHSQLSEYMSRYERRFTPKNLLYIKQILFVVKAFVKLLSPESVNLGTVPVNSSDNCRLLSIQNFLFETIIFNLNLFKIIQYMDKSKIAHKLHKYKKCFDGQIKTNPKDTQSSERVTTSSFLAKMASSKKSQTPKSKEPVKVDNPSETKPVVEATSVGTPLLSVIEFLKAITCASSDGRVVVNTSKEKKKCYMNYLLLNPASQFHEIVKECRSVIVAGGTMSPMDEFKNQLFLSAGACPSRVQEFSCNHVVPAENVLPLVLKRGPGSVSMDFTFKNRRAPSLLDELGRTLTNFCNVIPGGVVCFFPSYEFEQIVSEHFCRTKVIERISKKKKVFREPKKSSELDRIFSNYSNAVLKGDMNGMRGALLFSVVGGKMSEGINFSDELGRCVIMVGMPYPNSTSPVLKEKMEYLNKNFPVDSDGKTAGAVYYENLCFKAVNQSIGRSIRHKNDYASILLLDQRYALESSQSHLPSWISSRVMVCEQFGQAFVSVRKFFADKKQ